MKKNTRKNKKKKPRKSRHTATKTKQIAQSDVAESTKEAEHKKAQHVPVKRDIEKKTDGGRSPYKYVGIAGQFLREARSELKKVKWHTRKELLASTGMVIILVVIVSFYLGVIDFGLIKLIKSIAG